MIIRPIEPGDYDEWIRMRKALWPELSDKEARLETPEILSDPDQQVFVAARPDGGLGGFLETSLRPYAEGVYNQRVGYIEGWYIDADLRRQGLGGQLVRAAEGWARSRGCRMMASDCELDNDVSLQAHTALGYEEVLRLIHFRKSLEE